ncbi:hypothetical protein KM043_016244 [Ampulex compressa]|nr:hypothetical protein KM043_016244 [Ampulex compressa]
MGVEACPNEVVVFLENKACCGGFGLEDLSLPASSRPPLPPSSAASSTSSTGLRSSLMTGREQPDRSRLFDVLFTRLTLGRLHTDKEHATRAYLLVPGYPKRPSSGRTA